MTFALPDLIRGYQIRYGLRGDDMVAHLCLTPTQYDYATDPTTLHMLSPHARQQIRVALSQPPRRPSVADQAREPLPLSIRLVSHQQTNPLRAG